jgi:hypothetical protein
MIVNVFQAMAKYGILTSWKGIGECWGCAGVGMKRT